MNQKNITSIPAEMRQSYATFETEIPKRCKMTLPRTVRDLVRSYVADCERRERALKDDRIPGDIKNHLRELNQTIAVAALVVDVSCRTVLLEDIANVRGYYKSPAQLFMCKNSYYAAKDRLEREIAIRLNLFG